ncbi:nSTAND1 domain-containing NTPase [Streptomyces sp. NPDC003006]
MGRPETDLDPGQGPVQRFAFELRKLRQEAGGITYREMARQVKVSVSTLSRAAAGEQLPSLDVMLAYVTICGGDPEDWERRWRAVAREEAQAAAADEDTAEAPYRGLARFEADDAHLFFGRDHLAGHLTQLARQHRITMVFGPSGSGKSSLLRAGLIPRLRQSEDAGLRPAAIRILTPGARPARTHAGILVPAAATGETWLVVDQFEEASTLCHDPAERDEFISGLLAARCPGSRLRVVLGVRADFYPRCLGQPGLDEVIREASMPVGRMTPAELREAIVRPAAAQGLIVERALTARLIEEVEEEPGALPLLSHVLLETWRRRRGRTLTMEAYEAAGGLQGAIAQTAETLYTHLTPAHADTARRILLRLIAPGNGTPDTRRPVDMDELEEDPRASTCAVLNLLARVRLVILEESVVDLAHEALITAWPRLRGWVAQDRERLRVHRRLTEAATVWAGLDRDPGALYRGTRLASAEEHFPHPYGHLTGLEGAFLDASAAARDQEQRAAARTTRHLRRFSLAVSVLLVLALTAGVLAWQQSRASDRQRASAVAARQTALSRQLAAQSSAAMATDPDLAALLAVGAYRTAPTDEATASLYTAADLARQYRLPVSARPVLVSAFSPDGRTLATADEKTVRLWDAATGTPRRVLSGSKAPVLAAAFSADGRTLATADIFELRLWDTVTGTVRRTLPGSVGVAPAMVFSPDGHTLAVGDGTAPAELWDTTTGRLRRTLTGHAGAVSAAVFSPDGRTLTTASTDDGGQGDDEGVVTRWNVAGGKTDSTLTDFESPSPVMEFSPDGRTLATAGNDGAVRLRDTTTGTTRRTLTGHAGAVSAAVFSPDGRTLATADEKTVRLWDTANGTLRRTLPFPHDSTPTMAFSPGWNTLTALATTGTVRAWDITPDRPRRTFTGHTGEVTEVVFSPDGRILATADRDTVRLWDTARGKLRRTLRAAATDMTGGMAFSPGADTLAVSDADTVRLRDTTTGRTLRTLTGHNGYVSDLAFSPDGRTLATADRSTVRLWDAAEGTLRRALPLPNESIHAMAFGPGGNTLTALSSAGTVKLWDTATGTVRRTSRIGPVSAAAFSPDGHILATESSRDGDTAIVRLWQAPGEKPRHTLTGPTRSVHTMALSRDGRTLATGDDTGVMRLWDTATGKARRTLTSHTGPVLAVALSPDGRSQATGGVETVRLWEGELPTPAQAVRKICRAVDRELTPQERALYLSDLPAPPLCKS